MPSNDKFSWKDYIKQIDIYSKRGLEGFTAFIILISSYFFSKVFIIPLKLIQGWSFWEFNIITFIIFYLIKLMLFSSDNLYYSEPSNNSYARAFQKYWPSKYITKKFNLNEVEANNYWFAIFNKWKKPDHPQHSQWIRTLRRGYRCRFIYYCIKFSGFLIIISIAFLLTYLFVLKDYTNFKSQMLFIAIVLMFYIILRFTNRTSLDNLTGVWRQYKEINLFHIQYIDENFKSISDIKSSIKN
jgi:hypothetical protein